MLSIAFFLLFCVISSVRSQSCSDPDAQVLILGAGISGIAAAHTLNDKNVSDFLILEALPRIGGRIRQAELSSGIKVEIGANWIQGVDPNDLSLHPFYSILYRCGIDMKNFGIISDFSSLVVYDYQGNQVNASLLTQRCDEYTNAREAAEGNIDERLEDNLPDISFRQGLTMNNWTPSSSLDQWIEWFGFDWCFAETPNVTSLHHSSMIEGYTDSGETADLFVTDQRGYVRVVECLSEEFLQEKDPRLHLNTTVNKIQWRDDCVCVEATENGKSKKYCAPYAISTFSIGVLQDFERNRRFDPQLPEQKSEVINIFSMTHFLPLFVEFNGSFWDDLEYIGYVDENQRGYFSLFQPLNTVNVSSHFNVYALLATFTDEIANSLARQPKESITQELLEVLHTIYGEENVTEITNVLFPAWDEDPLFLGAWTNIPVGVTDKTIAQLAEPVGRLYFSGDGTSARAIGFSHGAYMAGIDSAMAVVKDIEASQSATAQPQAVESIILVLCLVFSMMVIQ